jgi:arylsulfatase
VPIPLAGVPSPLTGRTHFEYAGGVTRLPLAVTPDLTARAHRLTVEVDVPQAGADGVLVAEGGRFGGFSLFVKDGKLIYENNSLGTRREQIVADSPLPAGHAVVQFTFQPEGKSVPAVALFRTKPGPGNATLSVNGRQVGAAHFTRFGAFQTAIDEPLDVGRDSGSPVSQAYKAPNPYQGHVVKVSIDLL